MQQTIIILIGIFAFTMALWKLYKVFAYSESFKYREYDSELEDELTS